MLVFTTASTIKEYFLFVLGRRDDRRFSCCLLRRITAFFQMIILRREVLYQYKNNPSIYIFNRSNMPDFKNYRSVMRILLPNTKQQQQKNNKEPKVWEGLFFSPASM